MFRSKAAPPVAVVALMLLSACAAVRDSVGLKASNDPQGQLEMLQHKNKIGTLRRSQLVPKEPRWARTTTALGRIVSVASSDEPGRLCFHWSDGPFDNSTGEAELRTTLETNGRAANYAVRAHDSTADIGNIWPPPNMSSDEFRVLELKLVPDKKRWNETGQRWETTAPAYEAAYEICGPLPELADGIRYLTFTAVAQNTGSLAVWEIKP